MITLDELIDAIHYANAATTVLVPNSCSDSGFSEEQITFVDSRVLVRALEEF